MHAVPFDNRITHRGQAPARRRVRFTQARALWRDVGIGLAIAALSLTLTAFAIQAGGPLPAPDGSATPVHTGAGVAPAIFAPDAMPVP